MAVIFGYFQFSPEPLTGMNTGTGATLACMSLNLPQATTGFHSLQWLGAMAWRTDKTARFFRRGASPV